MGARPGKSTGSASLRDSNVSERVLFDWRMADNPSWPIAHASRSLEKVTTGSARGRKRMAVMRASLEQMAETKT